MNSKVKKRNDEIVEYYLQQCNDQKFNLDIIEEISQKFFLSEESIKTIITKNTDVISIRIPKKQEIKPIVIRPKLFQVHGNFSKGIFYET